MSDRVYADSACSGRQDFGSACCKLGGCCQRDGRIINRHFALQIGINSSCTAIHAFRMHCDFPHRVGRQATKGRTGVGGCICCRFCENAAGQIRCRMCALVYNGTTQRIWRAGDDHSTDCTQRSRAREVSSSQVSSLAEIVIDEIRLVSVIALPIGTTVSSYTPNSPNSQAPLCIFKKLQSKLMELVSLVLYNGYLFISLV